MFSTKHFIWLGLSAVFIFLMTFFSIKKKFPLKVSGYIMTCISAFSEISKIMNDMIDGNKGGMVLSPTSLPFHLCSLMLFCVLIITFAKDGKLKQVIIDLVAVFGVIGSFCALMIPTNGTDFTKIGAYQCFVYHAALFWFALYLILSKNANMGLKAYGRNMIILFGLVIMMIYINSALSVYSTNFMYLVRPPMSNLPFLNLNHGWYVYFLHLVSTGIAIVTLFYLPFIIKEHKTNKNQ